MCLRSSLWIALCQVSIAACIAPRIGDSEGSDSRSEEGDLEEAAPDAGAQASTGPCVVTRTEDTIVNTFYYDSDQRQTLQSYENQSISYNREFIWNGNGNQVVEALETGLTYTRRYRNTPSGLAIDEYETSSTLTVFEYDGTGNLLSAHARSKTTDTLQGSREFESENGQVLRMRSTYPGVAALTEDEYEYDGKRLVRRLTTVNSAGGSSETTRTYSYEGDLLIQVDTDSGNDGTLDKTATYAYKGDCDGVSANWWVGGEPGLAR